MTNQYQSTAQGNTPPINNVNSEASEKKNSLRFETLQELMRHEYSEQEYLLESLIPEDSITIFSGPSRSYKTYALLHMAISIASGETALGNFAAQKSAVLIIDEENGARLLQKRLKQLKAPVDLPIHFLSYESFESTPQYVSEVLGVCKIKGIKLVIIDSLVRIHSGDENSSRDMSKVFKNLRVLTNNGIAVVITHHTNKQGGYRGSTDIMAAVDSFLTVVRKNKHYLTFSQIKQRYSEELDDFEVKVNTENSGFEFEYLGTSKAATDTTDSILSNVQLLLTEKGKLNQKQLQSELTEIGLSINEHKLRELLRRWTNEGTLPHPYAGDGNTKLYHLGGENE